MLPARLFVERIKFKQAPSIFFLNCSDRFFMIMGWFGLALSVFALSGLSENYGWAVHLAVWILLWAIYMSFINVGQTFYGFGWESLLLEAGFLAIFLGPANVEAPVVVMWMYRWLIFRVMFGAGLIKLRGDQCWRDLTCMDYHYLTQPVPNPWSWYWHQLPSWFQKCSVFSTHIVELIVPFFVFLPAPICYVGGILIIGFQAMLIISGNLSWLNWITIAVCIPCFDDAFFQYFMFLQMPEVETSSRLFMGVLVALSTVVAVFSIRPVLNLLTPSQAMNTSYDVLRIVNTYGAFGSISKRRMEVVIQGTSDARPTTKTEWKEYEFKVKPGDVSRRPGWMSPYHYRIDWQMWFAAMGSYQQHPWLLNLIAKFLQGDSDALSLIAKNPFPDEPPKFIQATLFEYKFTEYGDESGNWWVRKPMGQYMVPLSLDNPSFKDVLKRQGWID